MPLLGQLSRCPLSRLKPQPPARLLQASIHTAGNKPPQPHPLLPLGQQANLPRNVMMHQLNFPARQVPRLHEQFLHVLPGSTRLQQCNPLLFHSKVWNHSPSGLLRSCPGSKPRLHPRMHTPALLLLRHCPQIQQQLPVHNQQATCRLLPSTCLQPLPLLLPVLIPPLQLLLLLLLWQLLGNQGRQGCEPVVAASTV